jgi:hypothetical protein
LRQRVGEVNGELLAVAEHGHEIVGVGEH